MSKKNKNIVFLTPGFPESENDSTTIPALQIFLKSLRSALPDANLTLITFQFPHTNKSYNWHGIEVIPLNGQGKKLNKLWTWKKALKTLQKLHKSQKIDTIHSFWIGECTTIGERFAKKSAINHVVTVMGQDATVVNFHAKKLMNSNAKIITLSKNHHLELFKTYNLESIIIPWHLHVTEFPELQNNNIDVLGVGSLNSIKNYSNFIDIIFALKKKHSNLKVCIIGEGKLQNTLELKVKNLGLDNTITFLGKLSRTEVLQTMAQSNILLHTSLFESFGFVFLEALYSGMQIASYNVGLAKPSLLWKVCNNKNELTKACEELLLFPNNEKKRTLLGSEKKTINSYLALYNE